MRLKRLIKTFQFDRSNYSRVTLGPDVRLNINENRLQLKETVYGITEYKTDDDLYAKTWVTNPNTVKQWLGFEAYVTHSYDDLGDPVTSVGFRLGDGSDEYWWDGGAWVINTTDWNTEVEVAANISTFPVASEQLQVIINLKTTDQTVTPYVTAIKVLYSSDVEHEEDYIWRSLLHELRDQVRPIADYAISLASTTDTIDFDDYPLETPYNVVGIDAVFNHTDDPEHQTDLFSSYDSGTKVITLSSAQAVGKIIWIRLFYEPEVAVTTGQEYVEVAKVPALALTEISHINSAETGQDDWVVNKSDGTAVKVPAPRQCDIDIRMQLLTDKAKDQTRLADEMKRFFGSNPKLTSKGMDEEFRLWLLDEYEHTTEPSQSEIHAGQLRFRIVKALFFERPAQDVYAVERFNLTGHMNVVVS